MCKRYKVFITLNGHRCCASLVVVVCHSLSSVVIVSHSPWSVHIVSGGQSLSVVGSGGGQSLSVAGGGGCLLSVVSSGAGRSPSLVVVVCHSLSSVGGCWWLASSSVTVVGRHCHQMRLLAMAMVMIISHQSSSSVTIVNVL